MVQVPVVGDWWKKWVLSAGWNVEEQEGDGLWNWWWLAFAHAQVEYYIHYLIIEDFIAI